MAKQIVMTESGLEKLKEELDFLKSVKRKEAAENVGIARSFGDLSENSEYDEAKNEQAKVEAQIAELEETIKHVTVISDSEIQTDSVRPGVTVGMLGMEYDEEDEFTIVNSHEVDPAARKISDQSPIGEALIGTKVGDIVTVEVPDGTANFKILKITRN